MPTLFSVFPSIEGAWEDTLNFLLNAIIIKSTQHKLNPSKKQVNVANYFLHNSLLPPGGTMTGHHLRGWSGLEPRTLPDDHSLSALYPSRVEETGMVLSLEQTERHSRRPVQRGTPSQKDTPNPGDSLGMGQGWGREGLCPQDT